MAGHVPGIRSGMVSQLMAGTVAGYDG